MEKGLVDRAALDALVDAYENKIGPRNGARVVARAWADSAFKERLSTMHQRPSPNSAMEGTGRTHGSLENSPSVHNLVVCTLCSCYPWPILGLPPVWYKSAPYRSRSVIDPRGVLREFGLELPEDWRFGSPIARRRSATSSCRKGRPHGKDDRRGTCGSGHT